MFSEIGAASFGSAASAIIATTRLPPAARGLLHLGNRLDEQLDAIDVALRLPGDHGNAGGDKVGRDAFRMRQTQFLDGAMQGVGQFECGGGTKTRRDKHDHAVAIGCGDNADRRRKPAHGARDLCQNAVCGGFAVGVADNYRGGRV